MERMPNVASLSGIVFLGGEFGPRGLSFPFQFLVFKPTDSV